MTVKCEVCDDDRKFKQVKDFKNHAHDKHPDKTGTDHYTVTRTSSGRSSYYGGNAGGSGGSSTVWDSGLEVIEEPTIIVPEEVRRICSALQEEVNNEHGGGCEFGVLFKAEWTDAGLEVKPDYVVPEQDASRAHITYTEDLKQYRDRGYIVNAHSHPWAKASSTGFSGTDDDHINTNFNAALLFAGSSRRFGDAVLNLEVDDGVKVQLEPEIEHGEPDVELPEVDIEPVDVSGSSTGGSGTVRTGKGRVQTGSRTNKSDYSWEGSDSEDSDVVFTEEDDAEVWGTDAEDVLDSFEDVNGIGYTSVRTGEDKVYCRICKRTDGIVTRLKSPAAFENHLYAVHGLDADVEIDDNDQLAVNDLEIAESFTVADYKEYKAS